MILDKHERIDRYTREGWWGTDTVNDLLTACVAAKPDALAVTDPLNRNELAPGDPLRLTYSELETYVNRLATALLEHGIAKDDILMVQLPNIVELILVYLAAARIGAIVSPLPVQYRTHELLHTMGVVDPKLFITTSDFQGFNYVEMVQALDHPSLESIIALGADLPDGVVDLAAILNTEADESVLQTYLSQTEWTANDIFTVCWTSGTEAEPKGVPRSHNQWINIARFSVEGCEFESDSRLLNPFPMVNMSAIGGMLVPWLIAQCTLVMHHPLNLPVFLKQIAVEKITYTVAPPVLLNLLLLKPALTEQADLSSIKNIGSGSAPLSPWMVSQWNERHNIDVLNIFGSNEGAAFVSSPTDIPSPTERALYFPRFGAGEFEWNIEVANGVETKLVDPDTGEVVTVPDEAGEMAIRSPAIFPGYYKRPELTENAFDKDGFFYTGDLFAIDGEDGKQNRYRFIGRKKDVIIRGGFTISPEEIEGIINGHPAVADIAVIGCKNERLGEEDIIAVIVLQPEQTLSKAELNDYLREKDIADFKYPRRIVTVEALPRNPVGKVLKRQLRAEICG